MNTLGGTTKSTFHLVNQWSLSVGFGTKAVLPAATVVELDSDGDVIPVGADSSKAIGFVYRQNKTAGEEVAVYLRTDCVVFAKAKGAVAAGATIKQDAADTVTTNKQLTVAAVASGNKSGVGIALEAAADGAEFKVLLTPGKSAFVPA